MKNSDYISQDENSNEIVLFGEWETAKAFQRFIEKSDVNEMMGELGVTSESEVGHLKEGKSKAPK